MSELADHNGTILGLAPFNFDVKLLSLQYVDDIILFVNMKFQSIRALEHYYMVLS